jgi:hypothetical protein
MSSIAVSLILAERRKPATLLRQFQCAVQPPSTGKSMPVIEAATSQARNTTARQVLQQCRQFAGAKACNTNAYWLLI